MEQLIFIGIVVLLSIVDAVARKQRQSRGAGLPQPEEWDWEELEEAATAAPEDEDEVPGAPRPEYTRPYGAKGSEAMIPDQLWAELEAAGVRVPRRGAPPKPQIRRPAPQRPAEPTPRQPAGRTAQEWRSRRSAPAVKPVAATPAPPPEPLRSETAAVRAIHRSHAEFGTDPHMRHAAVLPGPFAEGPPPEVKQVRALLSGGGATLRQAMILAEVLGPPAALADPGPAGPGEPD